MLVLSTPSHPVNLVKNLTLLSAFILANNNLVRYLVDMSYGALTSANDNLNKY